MDACLCGAPCGAMHLVAALRPQVPALVAELWRALEQRSALDRVWIRGLTRGEGDG